VEAEDTGGEDIGAGDEADIEAGVAAIGAGADVAVGAGAVAVIGAGVAVIGAGAVAIGAAATGAAVTTEVRAEGGEFPALMLQPGRSDHARSGITIRRQLFPNSAANRFSPLRLKLTTRLPGTLSRAAHFSSVNLVIIAAPSVPAR
jgi:hypothetical protein